LGRLSERISYLKGLSEGLGIADTDPQGRIMDGVLDVLDDMVDDISLLRSEFEEFKFYVESIDDDLLELSEELYPEAYLDDDDYVEVTCLNCGEKVYFEDDVLEDEDVIEIICPKCNEVVFINDGSFDVEPSVINDDLQGTQAPEMNNNGSRYPS
jgi:DNA-directed RNA polymerase subunit RPC12/RpoP